MIHRLPLTLALTCSFLTATAAAQTTPVGSPESTGAPLEAKPAGSWKTKLYGFAELDAIHDSTQSFTEASLNAPIFPRGTYLGDNGRTQLTAKNSRIGLRVEAPSYHRIEPSAVINFDFFGSQPADVTENDFFVVGTM